MAKKKLKKLLSVILALSMAMSMLSTSVLADGESDEPEHVHSYESTVTQAPTCTEAGEETFTCSCGDSYTEAIDPLGHTWGEGIQTKDPTCTEPGEMSYTCTVEGCDGSKTVGIDPLGHSWDKGIQTKDPTCTEPGEMSYTCTVEGCGGSKTGEIAALGHTWDEGTQTKDPTCTEPGEMSYTCTVEGCGGSKTVGIDPLGHNLVDGICDRCNRSATLTPGTNYTVYSRTSKGTSKCGTHKGGSDSSVTVTGKDDSKLLIENGTVTQGSVIGYKNGEDGIVYQVGDVIPASILECMTPDGNNIYLDAVYGSDSEDLNYDYSLSGKTTQRKDVGVTSEGITYEIDPSTKTITFTIPANYSAAEININATEALNEAWAGKYMPGGSGDYYSIVINNLSGQTYTYKSNSFIFQSPSFPSDGPTYDFENEVEGYITGARTFDGEIPHYTYGIIRTSNKALKVLYGVSDSKKLSVEQLLDSNLGNRLIECGYEGGVDDLAEYYLDYYNATTGGNYTNLTQLSDSALTLGSGVLGGTVVNRYACESNPEVAGIGYSYFYDRLLSLVPDGVKDPDGSYSIGSYMRGEASYEDYCKKAWDELAPGATGALEPMGFFINGPYCTNPYQYMAFGFESGFKLTEKIIVPTPQPTTYKVVHEYYTDGSLSGSTTSQELDGVVDQIIHAADITKVLRYEGNSYNYDSNNSDSTITLVLDHSLNVIYLRYSRTTGGGGGGGGDDNDDGDDPVPPTEIPDVETPTTDLPDIPEEPVEVPEEPVEELPDEEVPLAEAPATGDSSLVWLALSLLSAAGLAWLTMEEKRRKENNL